MTPRGRTIQSEPLEIQNGAHARTCASSTPSPRRGVCSAHVLFEPTHKVLGDPIAVLLDHELMAVTEESDGFEVHDYQVVMRGRKKRPAKR